MEFYTALELSGIVEEHGLTIAEIMIRREMEMSGETEEVIVRRILEIHEVMRASVSEGVNNTRKTMGGLIDGQARKLTDYAEKGSSILPAGVLAAVAGAMGVLEVNATMGKIVAAPTAGSSGVFPSVIIGEMDRRGMNGQDFVEAYLTASAIGNLVVENASVSGAEGGCQAEIGTAAAMTASALVALRGGSAQQIFDAASFAFKNIMGLICDPVAGLVECPCSKRNGLGALNAMVSADMALAGIESIIPLDQVILTMKRVGDRMHPDHKETGSGGIAATSSAIKIKKILFEERD